MSINKRVIHNRVTKFYISRQPTTTLLPFLGLKPWAKYMALAKKKDDSNSLFFFLLFFLIGDFFFIHLHYQTCCRLGKEKRLLTYLQKKNIYIYIYIYTHIHTHEKNEEVLLFKNPIMKLLSTSHL